MFCDADADEEDVVKELKGKKDRHPLCSCLGQRSKHMQHHAPSWNSKVGFLVAFVTMLSEEPSRKKLKELKKKRKESSMPLESLSILVTPLTNRAQFQTLTVKVHACVCVCVCVCLCGVYDYPLAWASSKVCLD